MSSLANYTINTTLNKAGFSLLELMLSTGLAALMMAALMASLIQFNQHKLVAQTIVNQQAQGQLASTQLLHDWGDVCGSGVVQGTAQSITLKRRYQGLCIDYSYGLNVDSHSLKRRRAGGRYSSFLDAIEDLDFWYGIDTSGECRINLWANQYQPQAHTNLHQVWVQLTLRTHASQQLSGHMDGAWIWHEQDPVLLKQLDFIWRVPHVCS